MGLSRTAKRLRSQLLKDIKAGRVAYGNPRRSLEIASAIADDLVEADHTTRNLTLTPEGQRILEQEEEDDEEDEE